MPVQYWKSVTLLPCSHFRLAEAEYDNDAPCQNIHKASPAAFATSRSICLSPVREVGSWFLLFLSWCLSPRIAMETYIRQRQLIMSPLIPSRVIGENEPLTAVFNKVIATREVNHKGQGKMKCSHNSHRPLWFQQAALIWPFCFERNKWCV